AAKLGGGHYPRGPFAPADQSIAIADWTQPTSTALADALGAWTPAAKPVFTIELADSGRYAAPTAPLTVPAGATLTIRAKDGERPLVFGSAPWPITLAAGATLAIDGLWIDGAPIAVTAASAGGATANLVLRHVTLVPRTGAYALTTNAASAGALAIDASWSVLGKVDTSFGVDGFVSTLSISDAIVDDAVEDSDAAPAEALRAQALSFARATVLGATHARTLEATDAIFQRIVTVERTQEGCVRFSWLPLASKVPRTFRCQPALALAAPGADPAVV